MYKSLDDSAIDLQRLEKCLAEIAQKITESNKHNLTDINIICEEVFGQILNRLFEINLIAISLEINRNFPAVDLIDYDNKIAYQVTTQDTKEKINHTIEVFNRHTEIFDKVDELNILFLKKVDDKLYENEDVDLHNGKKFSYENNILDFSKLIKTSVYKGYKQDKIEMRGDRAEMSDFPLYLNTVAGGLDCRDQTIGGFSFVVKIYALPVVEIIG